MTSRTPSPDHSPEESDPSAQPAADTGLLTLIVHHSITVLILVLVLGLGIWGYLNFRDAEFFATVDTEEFDARLHPPLQRAQAQRLDVALQVYSLIHDTHPVQLRELVDAGLLVPSDLYYPRGPDSWTYERHGDGYTLESGPGPATGDDS